MKRIYTYLPFLASLIISTNLCAQEDGQSGGGESAAESSVTTSSSQKSAAAPETIESNPIVTVVKTGLPIATALSSGITIDKIVKLAQAGGSLSNLKTVSAQAKTSGATYFTNIVSAAEKGITFKDADELTALNGLITATEFDSTQLDDIRTNQVAGVSIVKQKKLGISSVKDAVTSGGTLLTDAALEAALAELDDTYEKVKDIDDDAAGDVLENPWLADIYASVTATDPVGANLVSTIKSTIYDDEGVLLSAYSDTALQTALANAVIVANLILSDATITSTASMPSALNVASLTGDGYNTELVKLLIKYGAVGDSGSALAASALNGFSATGTTSSSLSSFLTTSSSTSDYLGLLSTLTGDSSIGDSDGDDDNFLNPQTNTVLHVSMDKVSLAPGSNIAIGTEGTSSTVDVSSILTKATNHDDRKILVIGAAKDLTIVGDTTFTNTNDVEDHALVLGAADELYFRSEYSSANSADYGDPDPITLEYTGSNLGLGSESEMRLVNVNIKTGGNLAIASLDKVYIGQTERDNLSTFTVGTGGKDSDPDNVYIYANELIQVNGLAFAGRVDDVYMDAITIDLGNVTFPTNSDVLLRSRDGGLNFGDAARTVGDVNFIENVKHLSISENALTASDFDFTKGDGHINSSSALPNGTPHIKIRSR
jgi:hypothetical protein